MCKAHAAATLRVQYLVPTHKSNEGNTIRTGDPRYELVGSCDPIFETRILSGGYLATCNHRRSLALGVVKTAPGYSTSKLSTAYDQSTLQQSVVLY